jgi:hypothetical protein
MSEALALAGKLGVQDVRLRAYQVDRVGTVLADISTALQYTGQIDHDNSRAVARTVRCSLDPSKLPSSFLNAAPSLFNIKINYEAYYDAAWHTYPRGVFWIDHPQEEYTPGARLWTVQGADLTYVLSISTTTGTYVVPAGSRYLSQVAAIVSNFGLIAGFDPTADDRLTPVDFVWSSDTSWLQICTDLLKGINYYPLQADSTGAIVTRPRLLPALDTPVIAYTSTAEPVMIIEPFKQTRGDISKTMNQLKAIIDDPTRTTAFAQLSNYDPNSYISIASLGYVKSQELRSNGGMKCVYNAALLQDICAMELSLADCASLPAELHTFLDPRREGNELYTVSLAGTYGAVVTNQQYRVASWTFPLGLGGDMTHAIERANLVLLTE